MDVNLTYLYLCLLASILIITLVILVIFNRLFKLIYDLKMHISYLKDIGQDNFRTIKNDLAQQIYSSSSSLSNTLLNISEMQKNQLDIFSNQIANMTKLNEIKLEHVRKTLEDSLHRLQNDNNMKLEKMRATVEEKLQDTLEKRLSESFKIVSERLEIVHQGLGEMQTLANGVGDLKKVLSNVKVRGIWGEVQLDSLITQVLILEQYEKNVLVIPGQLNRVEFAIKLPGGIEDKCIWLPIDSKFPLEDFYRLVQAQENGNITEIENMGKMLENSIKYCAKQIFEKYISPPHTTDFAIMFLPIESLYCEVLKRIGLIEFLQREYRVIITSPTTLTAILNSLQMGFKTLAIEKRSSEVWKVLSVVKTEFLKFADVLSKTKLKIDQASKVIGDAQMKTRSIQRKLKNVETVKGDINDTYELDDEVRRSANLN